MPIIFVFFGCVPNRQNNDCIKAIDINVDNILLNSQNIEIDSFYIVKLETSDESLISSVSKIELYNNQIFIQTNERLMIFDMSGKYIRSCGRKGRGMGEYMRINTFMIDRKNQTLLIVDDVQKGVHQFNLNGKFLSTIKLTDGELDMCYYGVIDSDNNLFCANYIHWNKNPLYTSVNLKSKVKRNFFSDSGITSKSGETFGFFPISNAIDSIRFVAPFDPTIYTYDVEIKPFIKFNPSTMIIAPLDIAKINDFSIMTYAENESKGYFTGFTGIVETEKFLLLDQLFGSRYYIYNKEKEIGSLYSYSIDDELKKMPLINIKSSFRNFFVGIGEAYKLKMMFREIKQNGIDDHLLKLKTVVDEIIEDDNPLLLFYRIK